jgi:phosphotransferase system, enzyme I, PtsP
MLKTMRHIIDEVNNAGSLDEAMNIIVHRVRHALGTQACSIFLLDHDNTEFVLVATEGLDASMTKMLRIPQNQGLIGFIAERKAPVNLQKASQHERYHYVPGIGEEIYQAFLGVPILHRRKLIGILIVEQEEERKYSESEEAFLVTTASQLAAVLSPADIKKQWRTTAHEQTRLPYNLRGIPSASGVGIGQIVVVYPPADLDAIPEQRIDNIDEELEHFNEAILNTCKEIRVLGDRMASHLAPEEQALFDAYLQMLDSDSLRKEITDNIREGFSAQTSLKKTIKSHVKQFRTMKNEYLQERATDIEDLGRRILAHLQSDTSEDRTYPDQVVLLGNEVTATNLAEVPSGKLVGVVSGTGSSNSHVAILARALGVPSVMGIGELPLPELHDIKAVVDGYIGEVYLAPDDALLKEFQTLADEEQQLDADLDTLRDQPAETEDGHRVNLYVNTGLIADVGRAMTAGAEGIGLYRTEVPFMTRDCFPSTEEQRVIYRQLLKVFSPRPVTMRVLDIGGDKPLSYFPIEEDNPFLGWRGIRLLLEHPEIFLSQIRAMLRASEGFDNLRIMLPLISDLSEVQEATQMIRSAYDELKNGGLDIKMPQIGIMIEVPSAVYEAQAFAQRVDFLSVGSNDLTQYILAVDRNNARVANLYDALHPAVLKALKQVVDAAHLEGKSVSICGEMAADPAAAILLLGMGYDMFSMSAPMLPRIKWVIRQFSMSRARKLLSEALAMQSPADIRRHLEFALEEKNLGGLIRAGKH